MRGLGKQLQSQIGFSPCGKANFLNRGQSQIDLGPVHATPLTNNKENVR
jgi:hypothetical protein